MVGIHGSQPGKLVCCPALPRTNSLSNICRHLTWSCLPADGVAARDTANILKGTHNKKRPNAKCQ